MRPLRTLAENSGWARAVAAWFVVSLLCACAPRGGDEAATARRDAGSVVAGLPAPAAPKTNAGPAAEPSKPAWRPTNFRPGELDRHFKKHGREWGAERLTRDDYLERARSLLAREPGGEILGHTRANGDILRYNRKTNEFAVAARDGTIRTLFRPDGGLSYWKRQVSP